MVCHLSHVMKSQTLWFLKIRCHSYFFCQIDHCSLQDHFRIRWNLQKLSRKRHRHINIFTKVQGICIMDLLVDLGRVEEDPPLRTFVLGKDTKKNLRSYPCKTSLLKKEYLKQEVGQAKRGSRIGMISTVFFKMRLLHIHLGRCRLAVFIDSFKLHNNRLCCTCFPHNSVCYNQVYVCIEFL